MVQWNLLFPASAPKIMTGSSETTCSENGSSRLLQNVVCSAEVLGVILQRLISVSQRTKLLIRLHGT